MEKRSNGNTAKAIETALKSLRKRCEAQEIEITPKSIYVKIIIAEEAKRQKVNHRQLYFILFGKRKKR